jgi:hypothetical protein
MFKKDDEDKLLRNFYAQKRKERIFLHTKTLLSGYFLEFLAILQLRL